jgi:hypothetical protein
MNHRLPIWFAPVTTLLFILLLVNFVLAQNQGGNLGGGTGGHGNGGVGGIRKISLKEIDAETAPNADALALPVRSNNNPGWWWD